MCLVILFFQSIFKLFLNLCHLFYTFLICFIDLDGGLSTRRSITKILLLFLMSWGSRTVFVYQTDQLLILIFIILYITILIWINFIKVGLRIDTWDAIGTPRLAPKNRCANKKSGPRSKCKLCVYWVATRWKNLLLISNHSIAG